MAITLGLFRNGSKEPVDTVCFSNEADVKRWKEYLFSVNLVDEKTHSVFRKVPVAQSK